MWCLLFAGRCSSLRVGCCLIVVVRCWSLSFVVVCRCCFCVCGCYVLCVFAVGWYCLCVVVLCVFIVGFVCVCVVVCCCNISVLLFVVVVGCCLLFGTGCLLTLA